MHGATVRVIYIIIIEFLTFQLWLGNIHIPWDVVINRIIITTIIILCANKRSYSSLLNLMLLAHSPTRFVYIVYCPKIARSANTCRSEYQILNIIKNLVVIYRFFGTV